MSEHNQRPDPPDILEQAIDAVRSSSIPAGPPADVAAAIADDLQNRTNALRAFEKPAKRTRRYIRYGSFAAAAAVVVWVFVGLIGLTNGTARAFEKAVEKLRTTDAVRYQVQTQSSFWSDVYQAPISSNQVDEVTIRGRQMRVELVSFPKLTWIINWEISGMLILDPPTKTYQTVDLAAKTGAMAPFDTRAANMREQMEDLIKQKPIFEKADAVDGIMADRYAITGGESLGLIGDWTIWLERKSNCPVRVAFKSTQPGKAFTREYSRFDWNPKIAQGAFSFEPPSDYREHTIFQTVPPLAPLPRKK